METKNTQETTVDSWQAAYEAASARIAAEPEFPRLVHVTAAWFAPGGLRDHRTVRRMRVLGHRIAERLDLQIETVYGAARDVAGAKAGRRL